MDLTSGKIAWTDQKVRDVFTQWAGIQPFTTANHAALDWEDAATLLVQGKAANYIMGNFAVGNFKEGGMTNENLGFMVFPEITPELPRADDAPTNSIHIPTNAKNPDDAKKFLAYVASAAAQTKLNASLKQLPTKKHSTVHADARSWLPVSKCCHLPTHWRSFSTVTHLRKWQRPAWRDFRSS